MEAPDDQMQHPFQLCCSGRERGVCSSIDRSERKGGKKKQEIDRMRGIIGCIEHNFKTQSRQPKAAFHFREGVATAATGEGCRDANPALTTSSRKTCAIGKQCSQPPDVQGVNDRGGDGGATELAQAMPTVAKKATTERFEQPKSMPTAVTHTSQAMFLDPPFTGGAANWSKKEPHKKIAPTAMRHGVYQSIWYFVYALSVCAPNRNSPPTPLSSIFRAICR